MLKETEYVWSYPYGIDNECCLYPSWGVDIYECKVARIDKQLINGKTVFTTIGDEYGNEKEFLTEEDAKVFAENRFINKQ